MTTRLYLLLVILTALGATACDDASETGSDVEADTGAGPDFVPTPDAMVSADGSEQTDTSSFPDGAQPDATSPADATTTPDLTSPAGGPDDWIGEILFEERFEDSDWGARDWYDTSNPVLTTVEARSGSSSWECRWLQGQTSCEGRSPGRHLFSETEAVYLGYWVKYSANYVGSDRPYHPHEFHFITNLDDMWVGPANTHLTTYTEQVGGRAMLALQDSRNVDTNCVLRNNDTFEGCNGDFDSYVFDEDRSVCACNGLVGDVDGRDCFDNGGYWYSSRSWHAPDQTFTDSAGPRYKNDWHHVQVVFVMNSIVNGIGVPDGRIRYWLDGDSIIASDAVLMRTGANPTMMFNQFLTAPYIGDGSPSEQVMWVDDLVVARAIVPGG